MTTQAITTYTPSTIAAVVGVNTHFQYGGSVYQKNNGVDADPQALTVVGDLGVSYFRERLSYISQQQQAIDALAPMEIYAHPCDINSSEADIRAVIHSYATDTTRRAYIGKITGANEANNQGSGGPVYNGSGGSGSANWYDQAVWQQYIIKDQVEIEQAAGNWTGGKPKIVGCSLKRAGSAETEAQYDADIASLKAATYTTAGVTYHMADLCDEGDFHWYAGWDGPGNRMNGKDTNGNVPAGLTVSSIDGRVSQEAYELQRARQIYDSMLTGGTGALVSGHWKYTGGSVTTGHGATFDFNHSEWGTPIDNENGHTDVEWQARGALLEPGTILRDYALGIKTTIPYQALTDKKTDGLRLGMYQLSQFPTGAMPKYTAIQTLWTYVGGETFTGVYQDISGHLPDCTTFAFSKGSGSFDLYILREADSTVHLLLDVGSKVVDGTVDGDGTYHITLADTLTIVQVVPNGGSGGAPVWTDYIPDSKKSGLPIGAGGIAATGATSYSVISGSLPPGVTLNTSTGALGGTPTTDGYYPLKFRATNGSGDTDSPDVQMEIGSQAAFVNDSPPLTGTVGTSYEYLFTASGFPDATFTAAGTAVPGLTMSSNGDYSGVPTTAGSYTMHATTKNHWNAGLVNGANHTIVISGSGGGATIPVWQTYDAPPGQKGSRYGPDNDGDGEGDGFRFVADGGAEDPTYTLGSGAIPVNLVLSASGNLRGKPTTVQTVTFTVIATNSAGSTESPPITVEIVDNGEHGAGQTLTIELAGHGKSGFRAYVRVKDSFIAQSKSARFCQIEDINKNAIAVVNMKQSGQLAVDDKDSNSMGKGDQRNFAITPGSEDANWFRIEGTPSWDGTQTSLKIRAYGVNPSGIGSYEDAIEDYADEVVCVPTPSAEPFAVTLGNKSGEIYVETDSVDTRKGATWLGPKNPQGKSDKVIPAFTMTGGATSSGVIVKTITDPGAYEGRPLDLAYTTNPAFTTQSLSGARTIDELGTASHTISGLDPDTTYYGRAMDSGTYVGETFTFKTLPDGSGAWERKIAVMSCLSNPSGGNTPQFVFDDIVAWGPDEIWHQGDLGYWGQDIDQNDPPTRDVQKHIKVAQKLPRQRAVFQCASHNVLEISDHELHSNSDGETDPSSPDYDGDATGSFNCPHSVREIQAFQSMRPVRTYLDTRPTRRHRAYYFDIGTQVRVIVSDFRTPDRSFYDDPESDSKSIFGAVQTADLRAVHDPNKLNIFVLETTWWHGHSRAVDKPARYTTDQADWEDFWNGTGDYAGGPVYQMAMVNGDRHRSSYIAQGSTGNFFPGPQYTSSGLLKNALALDVGETVDWSTYTPDNTTDKFNVSMYGQLTLAYDGTDTVTAKWNIRVVNTLRQVDDGTTSNGSTTITSQTAAWTSDDVGQLIAGDGIVNTDGNGDPKPTYITAVDPDGITATISNPAKATRSGNASWTIQNNMSQWDNVYDFPGGSITTDTWTISGGGGSLGAPGWVEG